MAWDGFTNQVRSQIRALAEGINAPLRLVIAANKPLNSLKRHDVIEEKDGKYYIIVELFRRWVNLSS